MLVGKSQNYRKTKVIVKKQKIICLYKPSTQYNHIYRVVVNILFHKTCVIENVLKRI